MALRVCPANYPPPIAVSRNHGTSKGRGTASFFLRLLSLCTHRWDLQSACKASQGLAVESYRCSYPAVLFPRAFVEGGSEPQSVRTKFRPWRFFWWYSSVCLCGVVCPSACTCASTHVCMSRYACVQRVATASLLLACKLEEDQHRVLHFIGSIHLLTKLEDLPKKVVLTEENLDDFLIAVDSEVTNTTCSLPCTGRTPPPSLRALLLPYDPSPSSALFSTLLLLSRSSRWCLLKATPMHTLQTSTGRNRERVRRLHSTSSRMREQKGGEILLCGLFPFPSPKRLVTLHVLSLQQSPS